jgi:hypothetical protein
VPEFTWDVQIPGEDLPHRLTTDYLVSEGEEITVDGRNWIVERVELEESIGFSAGIVFVSAPHEPLTG